MFLLGKKKKEKKNVIDVVVDVAGESHNGRQRTLRELSDLRCDDFPVTFSHYKYKGEPAIKVFFYSDAEVGVVPADCVSIVSRMVDVAKGCRGSIDYSPNEYGSGGFYSAQVHFEFDTEPPDANSFEEDIPITLTGIAKNQGQLKVIHQLPVSARPLRFAEEEVDGKNVYNVYLFDTVLLGKISRKNYELIINQIEHGGIVELVTEVKSTGAGYNDRYSASLVLHV